MIFIFMIVLQMFYSPPYENYKGVYSELGSLFGPINALLTLATLVSNAFYLFGFASQVK